MRFCDRAYEHQWVVPDGLVLQCGITFGVQGDDRQFNLALTNQIMGHLRILEGDVYLYLGIVSNETPQHRLEAMQANDEK